MLRVLVLVVAMSGVAVAQDEAPTTTIDFEDEADEGPIDVETVPDPGPLEHESLMPRRYRRRPADVDDAFVALLLDRFVELLEARKQG